MLRVIILLSVYLSPLTFVPKVYAASEPLTFTSDITYSHNFKKQYARYPEAIDKAIEHFVFSKLIGHGGFLTVNNLDQMNRIYIPKQYGEFKDQRLILAKSGFEVTGAVKYGEIYEASAGYIVHFKTKQAGDVALFFKGISIDRIQKIKNEITTLLALSSKSQAENNVDSRSESSWEARANSFQNIFFPPAYAQDENGNSKSLCSNSFSATPTGKGMDASALEYFWGCTSGLGGGVWDSTVGVVPVVFNGTKQLLTLPIDTFNNAANEFSKIAGLFTDFEKSFGNLTSSFQALPQPIRLKIACEVFSSLGTTLVISFLTSGTGSPLFLKAIIQALQKILAALPVGSETATKVAALINEMEAKTETAKANLDLIKQIDDKKKWAEINQADMNLLKPTISKGRDPDNLAATLAEVAKSEEFEILPAADRAEVIKLLKAEMQQQAKDYETARDNYDKLKIRRNAALKFLKHNQANNNLTLKQKAAIASYFAVSGCSQLSSVAETVRNSNDRQKGQADQTAVKKGVQ